MSIKLISGILFFVIISLLFLSVAMECTAKIDDYLPISKGKVIAKKIGQKLCKSGVSDICFLAGIIVGFLMVWCLIYGTVLLSSETNITETKIVKSTAVTSLNINHIIRKRDTGKYYYLSQNCPIELDDTSGATSRKEILEYTHAGRCFYEKSQKEVIYLNAEDYRKMEEKTYEKWHKDEILFSEEE